MVKDQKCIGVKSSMFITLFFFIGINLYSQEYPVSTFDRDTLITAARELINSTKYCALITLDGSGHPQVRTMDPFTPEKDMVVWMGTNPNSRKVQEIRNDSRATLYYEDSSGAGYVVLKGHASLVDDPALKLKYWKEEWNQFYSDQKESYVLIKMIPDKLEIVDYRHGITGDSKTWAVPMVEFK